MADEIKRCTVCNYVAYGTMTDGELVYTTADNGQIVCCRYCQKKLNERIKEMTHKTHNTFAVEVNEAFSDTSYNRKFNEVCKADIRSSATESQTLSGDDKKEVIEESVLPLNLKMNELKSPTDVSDTLTERGKRYGKFSEHARIAQNIKRAMQDSPNWSGLADDLKECFEMVAHKIARALNGEPEYLDNLVDIEGYVKLVRVRIETGEKL